jgi:hypothetical protein
MTRPLQVLVLESHPSEGAPAATALAAAGHEVVRCHEPGAAAFPCAGLVDPAACPLRSGVDVALDVRRTVVAEPTALEDGVGCALREGVPVVEATQVHGVAAVVPSALRHWTTPSGPDVVASVEAAAAASFDGLRAAIVAKLEPLFVANGVAPCQIDCEVEREGRRLLVHLVGPPIGRGLRQAASVRAYDVVRASTRSFDEIRLAYRPVVPPPSVG